MYTNLQINFVYFCFIQQELQHLEYWRRIKSLLKSTSAVLKKSYLKKSRQANGFA